MSELDHSRRSPEPGDMPGHHTGGGQNVISGGLGHAGSDVFFAAVQMSGMPMLLADARRADNPIVFCNSAFELLTGYRQDEILGRNCRFLQGADTDPEAVARIRDAIAARKDIREEIFNYCKDGRGFWNALFISPVTDPGGNLLYFFASQIDVTRRREAELVLQQSQRMETLGTMASGIAHEFNNLMTVVIASIEQARREVSGDRGHQQLDRAEWGARRAGRLTHQMLSFARRQFHNLQEIDLNEALAGFDSILEQMAGSGVDVRLELADTTLWTRLDLGQLELALLNLVRNAADAMPHGGEVVVRTGARRVGGAAETVELSVADTGVGMPAEVVRRAVEPFFTTKERGKGTGLGLSMVNGFAAQSGGELVIESSPGAGTTMRLVLPRLAAHAGA